MSTQHPRFEFHPAAERAMSSLDTHVSGRGLDALMLELVRLRASQLNGCAYCLDMHSKDARARGETEQRLYGLSAWRETPYYSEKERAALAWTEAVTLIAAERASDAVYDEVRQHFNEAEVAALTAAIIAINAWNRVAISSRQVAGEYVSSVGQA